MSNSTQLPGVLRVARPGDLDLLVAIDDDACALYAQAGIDLSFGRESPIVRDEQDAWAAAIREDRVRLAPGAAAGDADGFVAMGWKDGDAYVEQLSVRQRVMRRGLGRQLLGWGEHWARIAGARRLLLTTYGHVPWNRPFYERQGWVVLAEDACGPELRATLLFQRAHLPDPAQRVAMAKAL